MTVSDPELIVRDNKLLKLEVARVKGSTRLRGACHTLHDLFLLSLDLIDMLIGLQTVSSSYMSLLGQDVSPFGCLLKRPSGAHPVG